LSSWDTVYVIDIEYMFKDTPAMLVKPVWYPVRYINNDMYE